MIGRTESAFSPRGWQHGIEEDDREIAETGAKLTSEYPVPTPTGERTYLSVKFPIPDPNGGPPSIGGISTDITEQKRAVTTALEAARIKSEFLANMSHELRTPLNGVIGMAHLLGETELTETQREYVNALGASGEARLAVIGHVLDFSKLEARKLELDPTDFALHRLVQESCLIVGEGARAKGLTLTHTLESDVPALVHGDRARVRQILLNLLSNGVKFTSEGAVSLTVTREDPRLIRFEVADTGIGISPSAIDKLFAPFAQADQSTSRRFGGTGLGLAISRELVQLMGGEIGAHPRSGGGSVFWFTLQLDEAGVQCPSPSRQSSASLRPSTRSPRTRLSCCWPRTTRSTRSWRRRCSPSGACAPSWRATASRRWR